MDRRCWGCNGGYGFHIHTCAQCIPIIFPTRSNYLPFYPIMISNERTWPHLNRGFRQNYAQRPSPYAPRPSVPDDTLESGKIQIERKQFLLALKENPRGRFLRISEQVSGKFNSIIIPATGLREFQKLLEELVNAAESLPVQKTASSESPVPDAAA
jgi:PurA ssDNA and RNA-binding protein